MYSVTTSYVRHDSVMCVVWLIHMCATTHSYVWCCSVICVPWLIRMCAMTHSYVCRDSVICVPWRVPWRSHMCVIPEVSRSSKWVIDPWVTRKVWWVWVWCVSLTHESHAKDSWIHELIHEFIHEFSFIHEWVPVSLNPIKVFYWMQWLRLKTQERRRYSFMCVPCTVKVLRAPTNQSSRRRSLTVPWLIHVCPVTHSYVCHWPMSHTQSIMSAEKSEILWMRQRRRSLTHSYVCHDSFICVPWLIHMCAMTHSYVCHDSFICVPW